MMKLKNESGNDFKTKMILCNDFNSWISQIPSPFDLWSQRKHSNLEEDINYHMKGCFSPGPYRGQSIVISSTPTSEWEVDLPIIDSPWSSQFEWEQFGDSFSPLSVTPLWLLRELGVDKHKDLSNQQEIGKEDAENGEEIKNNLRQAEDVNLWAEGHDHAKLNKEIRRQRKRLRDQDMHKWTLKWDTQAAIVIFFLN